MSDMKHTALLFIAVLLLASCGSNDRGVGTDAATYIPDAPDYADATMWYIRQNSTADRSADVFYLVSTWETDWTTEVTVSVSPEHHVLVVKGYSGSEYQPILGFLNVGDFHSAEPWLYEEYLRENIRARVEAYYN